MNNPPGVGRFVHYVSKQSPHVESSALSSGTGTDWLGMLPTAVEMAPKTNLGESMVDLLGDGYSSDRHASLQVFGLVNVYPEWNVPYSAPVIGSGDIGPSVRWKLPGTWHWWDECHRLNDHIHIAPAEAPE